MVAIVEAIVEGEIKIADRIRDARLRLCNKWIGWNIIHVLPTHEIRGRVKCGCERFYRGNDIT